METEASQAAQECVFCAISAGRAEASFVHEDETCMAFMALHPVTPGHVLVVPRKHAIGLEDLDSTTGQRVWSVGHELARTLRSSALRPAGMNLFLCDGEAAFQTVFHLHLHVIPRYPDDSWNIVPDEVEQERATLDGHARIIRAASTPKMG